MLSDALATMPAWYIPALFTMSFKRIVQPLAATFTFLCSSKLAPSVTVDHSTLQVTIFFVDVPIQQQIIGLLLFTMASFRNVNTHNLEAFVNHFLCESEGVKSSVIQENIDPSFDLGQSKSDSSESDDNYATKTQCCCWVLLAYHLQLDPCQEYIRDIPLTGNNVILN